MAQGYPRGLVVVKARHASGRATYSPDMPTPLLAPGGQVSVPISGALSAADAIPGFGTDVAATLDWCRAVAPDAPRVGEGRTSALWDLLASTAARDVSAARMLEPHLDALSILAQADRGPGRDRLSRGLGSIGVGADSTWGVFAAEGAGMRLQASPVGDGWVLRGTKPWCSLAAHLSHALVTASTDSGERGLFAVDLRQAGVRPHEGPWVARGMHDIVSAPVDFDGVAAVAVGPIGWYLTRPGFAWGGMSVAACWWGGAVGVAAPLLAAARSERADQLALVHVGGADVALWSARAVLAEAAAIIDSGTASTIDDRLLAERVRAVVADAANAVLAEADAALGPAPLVADLSHARRAADLHLYLRQHHALRDHARIGRALVEGEGV
jgi:alkylation response protein AidB-like acyl-CoA dehydrogenase